MAGDRTRKAWPDYRAVWRWHFYAGLFCIPFVIWLALTGAAYLFKPQLDAWQEAPYSHQAPVLQDSPAADVAAALAAKPGWVLHSYVLPQTPTQAARIILGHHGQEVRVFVDRTTHQVLGMMGERQRLSGLLFHLHGELYFGDRGSMIVELAACWAIVMILTGLYLWWPRGIVGWGGILYPRWAHRRWWRDLHAVIGFWVSGLALILLFSGLPWAKNWGGYLKEVRSLVAGVTIHQDWTTGSSSELAQNHLRDAAGMAAMAGHDMMEMDGHHMGGHAHRDHALSAQALLALDRVVPVAAGMDLAPPVLISPPAAGQGPWAVRSDALNRTLRADALIAPQTGVIVHYNGFADKYLLDRIIGTGIAFHVGQLFGWPNQLIGVVAALGLVALSISAVILWLRRRPDGVLGAPAPLAMPRFSLGLLVLVVLLGVLLPLFGLSLLAVLICEHVVLRRLPAPRRWLGLQRAA